MSARRPRHAALRTTSLVLGLLSSLTLPLPQMSLRVNMSEELSLQEPLLGPASPRAVRRQSSVLSDSADMMVLNSHKVGTPVPNAKGSDVMVENSHEIGREAVTAEYIPDWRRYVVEMSGTFILVFCSLSGGVSAFLTNGVDVCSLSIASTASSCYLLDHALCRAPQRRAVGDVCRVRERVRVGRPPQPRRLAGHVHAPPHALALSPGLHHCAMSRCNISYGALLRQLRRDHRRLGEIGESRTK